MWNSDSDGVGCGVLRSAISRSRSDSSLGARLSSGLHNLASGIKFALLATILGLVTTAVFAAGTGGSISGTARDAQGAVIPGATVQLRNIDTGVVQTITTDSAGFYNFSSVTIGHYDVTFQMTGFKNYEQANVVINIGTARQVDATMPVGTSQQKVTVTSTQAQVDTVTAQMGEVIGSTEIENMPLNGRSYTDLLVLQPGVVSITTSKYGSLSPATLDNGLLSMSGAQDVHSGYIVNGADTFEGDEGGTEIIPNLDSIAQFRIITNNAGAEYGGWAGGMVNVVTKSGTNHFHGDAFEFYRNTNLDAAGWGNKKVGEYHQNIFGGTVGGPILRDKLFFFTDYQGTRQSIPINHARVLVPSAADKTGDLSDQEAAFLAKPSHVSSPYFAGILSSRLGYTVTSGEPYYTAGCTSPAACVFPNAQIPTTAWDPVVAYVLPLIPNPNSGTFYVAPAEEQNLTDNKGGVKIDGNTRVGMLSGYYHYDPWTLVTPFPTSSFPGFPSSTIGKGQLWVFSDAITFNPSTVNAFNASYTRNKNIANQVTPGPTLASLGFAAPANGGIYQIEPSQYQNYPIVGDVNFTLGPPGSVSAYFSNTYEFQDDFTKIVNTHTLKFGAQYHWDQVDLAHPNNGGNGNFQFNGNESGVPFADLLIGAPNRFSQGSPARLSLRTFYAGIYGVDSWRATKDLTVNYGVRWEVNPFWREANNINPVLILGKQSTTFPTAPVGFVFPGEPGVPEHMSEINWHDFSPRIGIAYAPDFPNGFLHSVFGDQGRSSIRLGYGRYYTNIIGANTFNFASPPYALFYQSPASPLFSQPFIDRASGNVRIQPFPIPPITNGATIDWSRFEPLTGNRNPLVHSASPYEEHVDVSLERSLTSNTVLSVSYVGTFGHNLTVNADNNPGNAALCLSVSKSSEVTNGVTCGPNGENTVYHPVSGGVIDGTRGPFGPLFGANGYQLNMGSSNYNALEVVLRHVSGRLSVLASYTRSKAIDNGSGFGDQVFYPGDINHFRTISGYDQPNNFVASYTYELPFDMLFRKDNRLTRGWQLSGITHFADGVPFDINEQDDHNLRGDIGNSPFAGGTDQPVLAPGNLKGDSNPRHQKSWFNTALFSTEPIGTQGNAPRRFMHGPGINNWDMALLKDVKVTSTTRAEFRAEFFNAFNHAQWYGHTIVGGNFLARGTFGRITSSAGGRVGEIAVKFYF